MNVWEYAFADDGYEEIGALEFSEHCRFFEQWQDGVRGKSLPKMKIWTNPECKIPARKGDFPPAAFGTIIFSARAVKAYEDLLQGKVNYLPIDCDCEERYYLADLPIVDCLDYEKSVIDYFPPGSNSILCFDRFAFKADIVANETIFQIPESRARIFVTDIFIERAKTAGLAGISFVKVWNSEQGSFSFLKVEPENKVRLG